MSGIAIAHINRDLRDQVLNPINRFRNREYDYSCNTTKVRLQKDKNPISCTEYLYVKNDGRSGQKSFRSHMFMDLKLLCYLVSDQMGALVRDAGDSCLFQENRKIYHALILDSDHFASMHKGEQRHPLQISTVKEPIEVGDGGSMQECDDCLRHQFRPFEAPACIDLNMLAPLLKLFTNRIKVYT
jgi:hypothetical protein